jgi:hypothetical protein
VLKLDLYIGRLGDLADLAVLFARYKVSVLVGELDAESDLA